MVNSTAKFNYPLVITGALRVSENNPACFIERLLLSSFQFVSLLVLSINNL
jgi:hypothetical protein